MNKRSYTYTVLRYVHDPLTGEFANIGVVMFCPAGNGLKANLKVETRKTIGRMREMFPDLDRRAFLDAVYSIDKGFRRIATSLEKEGEMLPSKGDASSFAARILPKDDSALQWGHVGSGVTADTAKTFEKLFRRFVSRYEEKALVRRSDEEVWKPIRQKLEERRVPIQFEKKTITGKDDKIEFSHAWKNGAWHAYEAVSLDLADAEGIYKKAHRWLGQLTSVAPEAQEDFCAYIVVGAPTDPALCSAYEKAVRILQKSPRTEVFPEDESDKLVALIEDEVRAHLQH